MTINITFDDNSLNGDVIDSVIPSGYQGFDWDNWYFHHRLLDVGTGFETGTVSGNYTSFNGFAEPAFMSRETAFSVLRLMAQSAYDDSGNNITFQGFDDQDNVAATHNHTMGTRADGPYLIVLPSSFENIYKFKFTTFFFGYLAIDDLVVVV